MIAETIYWHHPKDDMPDADTSVLIETAHDLDAGFYDGENWRWSTAQLIIDEVLVWSDMSNGIQPVDMRPSGGA